MEAQRSVAQCEICNSASTRFAREFFYCANCDYWRSNLELDIENTSAPDSEYELVSYEHTRSSNYLRILGQLKTYHGAGSSLLEIGCADGLFLKLARQHNQYEVRGIEPNTKMIASNPHNQQIKVGYFPQVLEGDTLKYDMIILNCVFEHVPNPQSLIESFKLYLKPQGTVVINVPVASGLMFRVSKLLYKLGIKYPFNRVWQKDFVSPHVHFFTSKSIAKLFNLNQMQLVVDKPLSLFSLGGIYSRLSIDPNSRVFQKLVIMVLLYCYYPISALFPDSRVFFFQRNK